MTIKNVDHDVILKEAIYNYSQIHFTSLLSELVQGFGINVVFKLIKIYSGKNLKVPDRDEIQREYRNRIIFETVELSRDEKTRKRLASFFGLSISGVGGIYYDERKKRDKTDFDSIDSIAKGIKNQEMAAIHKDILKSFLRKG